jgi:hypothetical protein
MPQLLRHLYSRINIISCFCACPLVDGLFKREVLKRVEALHIELNAQIQMGGLNLFFMNIFLKNIVRLL